ncbi:MAG: hypothetical protein R3C44_11340 [Chloroflexota bacterium]
MSILSGLGKRPDRGWPIQQHCYRFAPDGSAVQRYIGVGNAGGGLDGAVQA